MAARTAPADQYLSQADCTQLDRVLLLPQKEAEALFQALKQKEDASGKDTISLEEKRLLRYLVAKKAKVRVEREHEIEVRLRHFFSNLPKSANGCCGWE